MSETKERGEASPEDVRLDVMWVAPYLWSRRRVVCWFVGVVLVLGLLKYLTSDKLYECESSVTPAKANTNVSGTLGTLAELGGFNVGALLGANTTETSPTLWGAVLGSTPMMLRLMNEPLTWTSPRDTVESLLSRMRRDTIPTMGAQIKKYTIGLPWTIKGWLTEEAHPEEEAAIVAPDTCGGEVDYTEQHLRLDPVQEACAKRLSKMVLINKDDSNKGLYYFRTLGSNADQCAELNVAVLREFRRQLTIYSRLKSRNQLLYLEERLAEATADYQRARHEYYSYKDHHRNIVEERISQEAQDLEDAHELAYGLVKNLQNQVEKQRLVLRDETAPFGVVQPAVKPSKKAYPKFFPTMILSGLIGGFLAFAYLLGQLLWMQVVHPGQLRELAKKHLFTPSD